MFDGTAHRDPADPICIVKFFGSSASRKRQVRADALLTWAVALAAVVVSCFFVSESDLFMHLRNGERIIESGRLDTAEVYSYTTTETEFPNHEWLSNLLAAAIWRIGGFKLLVLAKAVTAGLLVLLLAAAGRGAATTALQRAHELEPELSEPLRLLGRAATDPVRAQDFLRHYLEMDPSGPWADDARARLLSD